ELGGLWPGDQYRVIVSGEGFGRTETAPVTGRRGEAHDFGRIVVARLGGVVKGRVVDAAGRPVAGASVFNAGDAPLPVSATTDAEGRFRLEDLQVGTVYVFAQKAGYRFAGMRTKTGSDVTVTLRVAGKAPAEVKPAAGASRDEQHQLARRLVEQVWNLPPGH